MSKQITSRIFEALLLSGLALASLYGQKKSWPEYNGGPDGSHFVESKLLTKSNISQLQLAWSYPYAQTGFNPLIVDKTMYVIGRGALIALDATTGKEIWIHEGLQGINSRGINYWQSKDGKDRRLIFSANNYLQEIDATTGKSILAFGKDGAVNLREGLDRDARLVTRVQSSSPGKVFENLVILGSAPGEGYVSPPGDLRAYDVITGRQVWQFHTIPHPGEFGYETFPKDAWQYVGGANAWSDFTIDEKRAIAYFALGSPTYDFYGADRKGDNLFGNTVLALDARTGKRIWHFQTIHHDLWDYDLTAAPMLTTTKQNGQTVDVVAQASKSGFLYVFDRANGKPIWPIVEKPMPKSDVPGEFSSPTQPIPTAPPPFVAQSFKPEDINPHLSAEERAYIKDKMLSSRNEGIYTPPSLKGTVQTPGNPGGANWGVTAANPTNGIVYVLGTNAPALIKVEKTMVGGRGAQSSFAMPGAGRGGNNNNAANPAAAGRMLYVQNCQSCHAADLSGAAGPALAGVTTRMAPDAINAIVSGGKSFMPGFPNLNEEQKASIIAFLANPAAADAAGGRGGGRGRGGPDPVALTWNGGTVVQNGPAPGAIMAQAPANGGGGGGQANYGGNGGIAPYPDGLEVPQDRYNSGYGLGGNALKPPFTTLTAYDLNKGTIKWQVPAGDDPILAEQGIRNTGARGLRVGIVPTATGIVFMVGGDYKLHAYDEDNGKELWTTDIAGTSGGSPSMYEIDGKVYLAITVSGPTAPGRGGAGAPVPADSKRAQLPSGYVVFALSGK